MNISSIVGEPGKKVSGRILVAYTTSRIPVELPVTIVQGINPGPTLVVTAGVHGRELVGIMGLGKVLRDLDPTKMSGNLVAAPAVNMSAVEFGDRVTLWDKGDLNRQKSGKKEGTVTQRLAYHLYHDVVLRADAYIDLHSSNAEGYVWYTICLVEEEGARPDVIAKSKEMALAFGLEQIFGKTPWKGTFKGEAIRQGIPSMSTEVGGGTDFFQNGRKQIEATARGIMNVMKLMRIIEGPIETESNKSIWWNGHTEVLNDGVGGLMLMEAQRGQFLKKGDVFATKYDATTGEEVAKIYAPADGTVLNTGLVWPLCPPERFVGVMGDKMEEVDLTSHRWAYWS